MNLLEAPVSLIIALSSFLFFASVSSVALHNAMQDYHDYCTGIRVLTASEVLMTSADRGVAEYSENTVKHHVIDPEKLGFMKTLSPEELGRRIGLRKAWLKPVPGKKCVTRIGLLEGEAHEIILCGE